jgi:hypothetical protein
MELASQSRRHFARTGVAQPPNPFDARANWGAACCAPTKALTGVHWRSDLRRIRRRLTKHKRNVIKLGLESPCAEDAGFRLIVEEADGFSVLLL